jgi:hypothetical protein
MEHADSVPKEGQEYMRQGTWKRFARISLFLLAICFVTDNMGSMTQRFSDTIGLCLLIAFALTYLPLETTNNGDGSNGSAKIKPPAQGRPQVGRFWGSICLVFLIIVSAALVLTHEETLELLGLSVAVFGLHLIRRKVDASDRDLPVLLLTILLFLVFSLLYEYVPQTWYLLQRLAILSSRALGHVMNQPMTLGITYSGLKVTTVFAIFYISALILSEKKSPALFAAVLLSLITANALYVIALAGWSNSSLAERLDLARPILSSLDFRMLLFALLLFPTFFYVRHLQIRDIFPSPNRRHVKRMALAAVMFISSIALLTVHPAGTKASKDVVFYDSGYLNWSLPTFGQYGFENIGMFGIFPSYLRATGYTARMEGELTSESLGNPDILVLINLRDSFDEESKKVIWDFVGAGGSLLVLGDHTGREQIREPFNDLLQPVKIKYNFDSAISVENSWEHAYEFRPHPILHGIDEGEIQISIGASLDVSPPSRPIILGKYGFSDEGNSLSPQGGYLGDMTFALGEQLGDLVLVAEGDYGQGKVLVFGDTSCFQNAALPHSYRFVDNVFDWLRTSSRTNFYPYNLLLSLALLVVGLFVMFLSVEANTASFMVCTAVLVLVLTISPLLSAIKGRDGGNLNASVANIDVSHTERCSLDPYSSASIDGLSVNLERNGYMPLILKEFSQNRVENSELFVIIAPARPFSSAEIDVIRAFVSRGGLLILTVGWEESEASQSLLQEFGLRVINVPLGGISPTQNPQGVSLWEAWPVVYEEGSDTEVLVRVWDYPVVVFQKYGEGGIFVVGDSSFLLNRNLEASYTYNEGNILFLKGFLDRFKGGWAQNG